jgi:hypothetical protein
MDGGGGPLDQPTIPVAQGQRQCPVVRPLANAIELQPGREPGYGAVSAGVDLTELVPGRGDSEVVDDLLVDRVERVGCVEHVLPHAGVVALLPGGQIVPGVVGRGWALVVAHEDEDPGYGCPQEHQSDERDQAIAARHRRAR